VGERIWEGLSEVIDMMGWEEENWRRRQEGVSDDGRGESVYWKERVCGCV